MGHGSKRPQFNPRQAHVTAKTMGCMVRGGQDHIRWKFVYTPHPENIAVSSTGMNYECRGDQGRIICMGVTLTIAWGLQHCTALFTGMDSHSRGGQWVRFKARAVTLSP